MSQPTPITDQEWIGVDLDATLAHYDEWRGIDHIGPPIPAMLARVKQWLSDGKHVRILTARVGPQRHDVPHTIEEITHHIQRWCLEHIGLVLTVTCSKDYNMTEFWDDRCVQVIPNTGNTVAEINRSKDVHIAGLTNDMMNVRDSLNAQIAEKDAQILALREVLKELKESNETLKNCSSTDREAGKNQKRLSWAMNAASNALSAPPPPVVPCEDVTPLLDALKIIAANPGASHGPSCIYDSGPIARGAVAKFTTKHPIQ